MNDCQAQRPWLGFRHTSPGSGLSDGTRGEVLGAERELRLQECPNFCRTIEE